MAIRTTIKDPIPERTSAKLTTQLQDEDGNGIPAGSLGTLKLTLYVAGSPASVINNRNKQDVLNINGVIVDSQGNLSYQMTPEDNQIIWDQTQERHIALFEWTWQSEARAGKHEILMQVINLESVP